VSYEHRTPPVRSHKFKLLTLSCAAALAGLTHYAMAASNDIPDLNGVWQWGQCVDGSGFQCMVLEENDPRLTNRAKAYRDAIDEVAQPKYDCGPMSIPHMWSDPYSYEITQMDDRIVIAYGKDDVVRTIWLEGHGHPKPLPHEFFIFGHSVGRYENGSLIVETTRFTFDPQGLNADFKLASSTQKKVTEVYTRDGDDLLLEVSTIDTFFLKEPWSFKIRHRRDPEPLALPWACDPEGARDSLKLLPTQYPDDPPIVRLPD